jgi:hypothetical protein
MEAPGMTALTNRRDLLSFGSALALGTPAIMGGGALATEATASTSTTATSPDLAALIGRYDAAYAAYDRICDEISEPARVRLYEAEKAASAGVPHVAMLFDMSEILGFGDEVRTYTTANRIDVICIETSCKFDHEPADNFTEAQHRLFAFKRQFNEARLERDAKVEAAVVAARRRHDDSSAIAQEDAAWESVSSSSAAVVECQPRSIADLRAKLAFYEKTGFLLGDALLEAITKDVAGLA